MRRRSRGSWLWGLSLLLLVAPRSAAAQPADASVDALMAEGKTLLGQGKVAEACAKMEQAYASKPSSAIQLELAGCHEKQGKVTIALAEYNEAAAAAKKERRPDREQKALLKSKALGPKIPKLTLTLSPEAGAVAGLALSVDGKPLERAEWGKALSVDPGEHTVSATAPDRAPWESRATVALSEKKSVAVPVLGSAGAAATNTAGTGPAAAETKPTSAPSGATQPTPSGTSVTTGPDTQPSGSKTPKHEADRLVIEISGFAAMAYGGLQPSHLDGIVNLEYTFSAIDGDYLQSCGTDNCETDYDTYPGLVAGGQLFIGWAMSEKLILGGRGYGGPRIGFGGGFLVGGGPAISYHLLDEIWIGGAIFVGAMEQRGDVSDIRGKGPEGVVTADGSDMVSVRPRLDTPLQQEGLSSEIAFGGSLEVGYVLTEFAALGSGSLMLATWPTYMQGLNGFVFALPVGLSVRLH
jgi:hypothetical protein